MHSRWTLERKISALRCTDTYPERTTAVETIETHMSWVFLTDQHAYKLKKPVRYDYLDFSTRELRRLDCLEEVRLNRRLAPSVYLGSLALGLQRDGSVRVGGGIEALDWLVWMRRLPRDRMLDERIRTRRLTRCDLKPVAARLGRFYSELPPAEIGVNGYLDRLVREIRHNAEALSVTHSGLDPMSVGRVRDAQLDWLECHQDLLGARVTGGHVVEGHGDLRPEHVCLEHPPVVFDCLEFNKSFRILDAVDELGFLSMECERIGAAYAQQVLFDEYALQTGDRPATALVAFYQSHRATLRAKLAIWHLDDARQTNRQHWRKMASEYLDLAERCLARGVGGISETVV